MVGLVASSLLKSHENYVRFGSQVSQDGSTKESQKKRLSRPSWDSPVCSPWHPRHHDTQFGNDYSRALLSGTSVQVVAMLYGHYIRLSLTPTPIVSAKVVLFAQRHVFAKTMPSSGFSIQSNAQMALMEQSVCDTPLGLWRVIDFHCLVLGAICFNMAAVNQEGPDKA